MDIEWISHNLCACLGPQDGEPVCPCAMAHVKVVDGRYIGPNGDLGPYKFIKKSRLETLEERDVCINIGHNPPENLAKDLKENQAWLHVCPTCKAEFRLMPTLSCFRAVFEKEELDKKSVK